MPGTYWIDAQKTPGLLLPTAQFPMVQSYVDIFLDGCMQVGSTYQLDHFSDKCVQETTGWPEENGAWLNDRVHPRRPFAIPHAFHIDDL